MVNHLDDMGMTDIPPSGGVARSLQRADWLRVLARAAPTELATRAAPILVDYRFEALRAPEIGLVMVRARIGNTGDRFNLGEATVSRCAVRHRANDDSVVVGVGHVLGRDEAGAEYIARLDALLQRESLQPALLHELIEPLRAARLQRDREQRTRTEATRVRFFALQPEATP
jgi:alpha-D-ribose 1-methylphosphonate 5-triphosphate synthase subunit PhnG